MIIAICATWARGKRVITEDNWFYAMCMSFFELILELSALVIFSL